ILAPDLSRRIHALKVEEPLERTGRIPEGVAFAGNEHLAVVAGSFEVVVFDTREWKAVRKFGLQENKVVNGVVRDHVINSIAASPDGQWLAAGYGRSNNSPGKIRIFEVKTGKTVAELD